MSRLNEKTALIFHDVVKKTSIEGTYDEHYLYDALAKYRDNCRSFMMGWTELEETIGRQERYLLASGFTQDDIEEIRFDAAFEGMMNLLEAQKEYKAS